MPVCGVCSVEHSHTMISAEEREKMGVSDNMIRLSVGLEAAEDLMRDIDQALNVAVSNYTSNPVSQQFIADSRLPLRLE